MSHDTFFILIALSLLVVMLALVKMFYGLQQLKKRVQLQTQVLQNTREELERVRDSVQRANERIERTREDVGKKLRIVAARAGSVGPQSGVHQRPQTLPPTGQVQRTPSGAAMPTQAPSSSDVYAAPIQDMARKAAPRVLSGETSPEGDLASADLRPEAKSG